MKYRNILLLIFCSLLCCGCSVVYTVDLDSMENATEDIVISATSDDDKDEFSKFSWNIPKSYSNFKILDDMKEKGAYYNLKKSEKEIVLHNYFKKDKYVNSTIVNNAFKYLSILDLNDKIIISTSQEFLLFDNYDGLDSVIIVVKSKKPLIDTNADNVEKHKYTWYITRDTVKDHGIYLVLDAKNDDRTFWEKLLDDEYSNAFTLGIIMCVLAICIFIFVSVKGKRKNKI